MAGFQQELKDGFFERGLKTTDYNPVGCATRLGPAQGLLLDGRCDDARGEEGDLRAVEQGEISGVIVIESHKKRGCRIDLPRIQAFAAHTEISNTDSPRETCIMHKAGQRPAGTIHAFTERPCYISFSVIQGCEV